MPYAYSVIIPAFNEGRKIAKAVSETVRVFDALHAPYEIIVVDDGSSDRTAAVVQELADKMPRLALVRHERNLGKGAAVRSGIERATGDVFLFLDADLATHPSEFRNFIPALRTADIVIGSRTARGTVIATRQPAYRIVAGKLFNLLAVRWYLGLPFHDTQCGFKAFRKRTKPLFDAMTSSGWTFDAELLARARKAGLRVTELPIEWRHGLESQVRLRDAPQILRELRKIKKSL